MGAVGAALLLAAAMSAAEVSVPADLRGACTPPAVAWRLEGVPPGATVVAVAGDPPGRLLVGGPRGGSQVPALGDVCLIADGGWGIRRFVTPHGMQGWPAMLRQVVLAGDGAGALHAWPLGSSERDLSPWKVDAGGPLAVGPLVVGGTFIYAGGRQVRCVSHLVQPRWLADVGGEVSVALTCDGLTVFAATAKQLVAVAADNGQERWRVDLPQPPQTGLLVTAGLIIAGLADSTLHAYDAGSGDEVWLTKASEARLAPHLALGGPWLFAADMAGKLVAVEAATGEVQWRASAAAPLGSPTIGFGHVFVIDGDGALVAVPVAPEQPLWRYVARDEGNHAEVLCGVASIVGPRLYVTSLSGELLALDLRQPQGPVTWAVPGGTAARNGRVMPPGQDE